MEHISRKRLLIGLFLLDILAIVSMLYVLGFLSSEQFEGDVIDETIVTECAKDTQICSDGSFVSRDGLQCEFIKCPAEIDDSGSLTPEPQSDESVITTTLTVTSSVALTESILFKGISITPLEVIEDSRCPIDVQCIQAGTVRIKIKLDDSIILDEVVISLGKATTFQGVTISLVAVTPIKKSTTENTASDYQFTFEISEM